MSSRAYRLTTGAATASLLIWRAFAQACLFSAALSLAVVLYPRSSLAVDPAVVEFAVDAFVAGGAAIGIPISKSEADVIKPLVQCIADGQRVIDCPKKLLIAQLPRESQAFVTCVSDTRDVAACGRNEVFRRLPPEARALADCIATQSDAVDCGKRLATSAAEKAALGAIDKLNNETRNPLGEVITPIQNIVNVVDGIAREDWEKVLLNGGKAVAKYVIRTVLTALLSQAGSFVAGPVIDVLVESRIDLAINLINALKAKDAPRIADILVEAYLLANVQVTCALIPQGAVHEAICGTAGKIIQAIGGAAGDVVGAVVDIIKDPFTAIGDDLKGLFHKCGSDSPAQVYANNFPICYHRAAYLKITDPAAFPEFERWLNQVGCRNYFINCQTSKTVDRLCRPAKDMFSQHAQQLAQALTNASNIYTRSFSSYMEANGFSCDRESYQLGINRFIGECESALQKQIPLSGDGTWGECRPSGGQQLWARDTAAKAACSKAVAQVALNPANVVNETNWAASAYANGFRWYVAYARERICQANGYLPEVSNFIDMCTDSLKAQVSACGSPSVLKDACRKALAEIDPSPRQVVAEVCAETPPDVPPRLVRCFEGMVLNAEGRCACPAGKTFKGRRCVTVSGPSPLVQPPPTPPPVPPFVQPTPPQPPRPVTCTDRMVPSPAGGCVCPTGSALRGGRCVSVSAPLPTPPPPVVCRDGTRVPAGTPCPSPQATGAICPDGTRAEHFELCNKRCPDGRIVRVREACPPPPPQCRGNLVPLPQGGCGCSPNLVLQGDRCVAPPRCRGKLVPLPQGGCGCSPNTYLQGDRCLPEVRCPDGSYARARTLCRKHCPDGKVVLLHQPCPGPAKPTPPPCPLVRTCVEWGKGSPGSLFGPCIRYENRPQCPSQVK